MRNLLLRKNSNIRTSVLAECTGAQLTHVGDQGLSLRNKRNNYGPSDRLCRLGQLQLRQLLENPQVVSGDLRNALLAQICKRRVGVGE
jgi:hypothetical protein